MANAATVVGAQFKVTGKYTTPDMVGKLGRCTKDDGDMLELAMQEGQRVWFAVETLERTSTDQYPEGRGRCDELAADACDRQRAPGAFVPWQ